jgi:nitroimidazol reductase NimA-like FMN-containing flavoprotein (pyridoxamine 5'-phosphate oxidase superfamily)
MGTALTAAADRAATVDLVELDEAECLRLLAGGVIGRVVFTDAALPAAQPVTYLLDGEEVVFRTAGGSKLAAATRGAVVAFQVDEFDPHMRTGWTVLGIGEAYEVVVPERLAELAERMPEPWAPNRTAHTIVVPLQRLTGRRLVTVPPAAEPGPERTSSP